MVYLCVLILSVSPDGCAGGLLLWLPPFEPADVSSPVKKKQHTRFYCEFRLYEILCQKKKKVSTDKTRLVTKLDNVCVRLR